MKPSNRTRIETTASLPDAYDIRPGQIHIVDMLQPILIPEPRRRASHLRLVGEEGRDFRAWGLSLSESSFPDIAMIGTRVGHVRIIGLLGQGGMGEVYLGFDERLQRRVALKAVRYAHRLSAGSRERLLREARVLSALDHPNICRIHDYAEGPQCDFLVLELIEGTTLRRAMEQGMSRARKLRVARDVAGALAAAHRRGIVHRDLKPDNVMIAIDGTVKVLDFGIARAGGHVQLPPQESDEDLDAADTWIFAAAEPAATTAAGTPLYMSPEQARGAAITTASDLFSFGLLLQMLLTGEEPRRADVGIQELLRLAAAGETLPMTNQPAGVTALVARLKSFAPAERPTAVETIERLDRILTAPARRVRRAAAAVVAALFLGGVAKYTIDVRQANRDAERRRDQAEALVAFIVDDLPRRLEPVGRLDVLDSAASEALEYFASLRPEELTGDELQRHARALTQLGDVRVKQGKLPEALAMFRQSLRFAAAAAQDPNRDEWQLALSNSHFWVADALRRQGDARGALAHFRAYYEISARLAAKHPHEAKYGTELSYGHSNLGSAYEALGDLARARAEYRTAAAIDRQRVARDPRGEDARGDLANSLNKLGVLLQAGGDLAGARAAFEEDAAIRRGLAAAKPDDARRARRLAASLAYLAGTQLSAGDVVGAIASDREELSIATRLAARDRENLDLQRNRTSAQIRLADALGARGEDDEAAALLDGARHTLAELTARDARPAWQRDLASAHHETAQLCIRRGAFAGAVEHGTRAIALAERVRLQQPADVQALRILCAALADLADVDERQGRTTEAKARRERVLALVASAPDDREPQISATAARVLLALGGRSDAELLVARLRTTGYRHPDFTARWRSAAPLP
jgi:eukaryotic-like serine/threonine-protein kinase